MQGAALAPRYTVGIKDPAEGFLHEQEHFSRVFMFLQFHR
jgi:hypothetical protein